MRDESARRKFERDKDELRALGIEIETVELADRAGDEAATGYRLRERGFYLPYLELSAQAPPPERFYAGLERLALSAADLDVVDRATQRVAQRTESALGRAAQSARRKLAFDLPLPQTVVERALARPLPEEGLRSLDVLQRAVAQRAAVRCSYYSIGRDAEEQRTIEPYGLFFSWSRWYCVAWAREREAMRVFRVDRMRDAKPLTGADSSFDVPEDFRLDEYVWRAPWDLSEREPERVVVRFAFPESRWVQAERLGRAIEPVLDDGGAILAFSVRERGAFLRWLLTFRRQAEVLEPEAVRNELDALRGRVAALYAEGDE